MKRKTLLPTSSRVLTLLLGLCVSVSSLYAEDIKKASTMREVVSPLDKTYTKVISPFVPGVDDLEQNPKEVLPNGQIVQKTMTMKRLGKEYNVVYSKFKSSPDNFVNYVLFIDTQEKLTRHIPYVKELYLHEGDGFRFYSLAVHRDVYEGNRWVGVARWEVKIPDNIANEIINLISGKTEFKNKTFIKAYRTNSPDVEMPKYIDFKEQK